jgi:ribonuclease P protein component
MRAGPKDGRASPSESAAKQPVATVGAKFDVLRRPVEFEAVLRSGVRVSTRNFVARALRNSAPGEMPRLGMIAGRKAASRAVDRNRVKRLIREIFRERAPTFAAYDVAVQLRSDLRSDNNESIRAELSGLLASLARRCNADAAKNNTGAVDAAARAAATTAGADTARGAVPGAEPHRQQ